MLNKKTYLYIEKLKKSSLVRNGVWLYVLQIFQTVIPLFTLPYVTRVLGVDGYGMFSIALNLILYIQVLVEYGFNLSGTRKIALSSSEEISEIYSDIQTSKIYLCILSLITIFILFIYSTYDHSQKMCLILLFFLILGVTFQQTWLFQGLQKMKFITLINVFSRLVSVVLIFIFIHDSQDVYLYCILYSSTYVISGIVSLIVVNREFGIAYHFSPLIKVWYELKDGFSLFMTSAMSKIVTGFGITVLGFFATNEDVGIYSAMQKIPYVLIMFFTPISQVLFPYISKQFSIDRSRGVKIAKNLFVILLVIMGAICFFIAIFAKILVPIIFGDDYAQGVTLIYVLLPWALISILNNVLGIQTLVACGFNKEYSKIFSVNIIVTIVLNVFFGKIYGSMGVAMATLIAESTLMICLALFIWVKRETIKGENNV
ncbi:MULTISPECIES: flippase [Eubacterium]|uniref:Polysaccharide transporter, PST family n=1 Tax=Eubacterium barkeri TaxID=1528 RepID=A0A1H3GFJ6_EUBBA|nr:flippase [Eubacterium barkeri]SDY01840.1 polysaccharide transporter, PST family [Eubacterium barkeri]